MKFKSCAQWPKGQYPSGNDITTDEHETEAAAKSICRALEQDGWGGEGKVFPIRTWTEPVH